MKTCYYTILSRPLGSQTWTPVPSGAFQDPKGNFFANQDAAWTDIKTISSSNPCRVWMAGLKKWAPVQFTVAYVCIPDNPDISTSPAPSPNLKPPQ
jgi:hypothetical protein